MQSYLSYLNDSLLFRNFVEVLSGLVEGDKIIAEGLTKVRPGMKVKPIIKSR